MKAIITTKASSSISYKLLKDEKKAAPLIKQEASSISCTSKRNRNFFFSVVSLQIEYVSKDDENL